MRYAVLAIIVIGCSTHNRVSGGPTLGTSNTTAGGELTGELATGGDNVMLVGSATVRAGHGLTGGAARIGVEAQHGPFPWGARGTVTMGPTMFEKADSDITARFETRGSVALVRGLGVVESYDNRGGYTKKRKTVGLEVFASLIGFSNAEVLVGVGLTIGSYTEDHPGSIAASRRHRKVPVANR